MNFALYRGMFVTTNYYFWTFNSPKVVKYGIHTFLLFLVMKLVIFVTCFEPILGIGSLLSMFLFKKIIKSAYCVVMMYVSM